MNEVMGLNTTFERNFLAGAMLAATMLLAACGGPAATSVLLPPSAAPGSGATSEVAATSPAAVRFDWTVEIVQGGAVLPESAGAVSLARAPFTIRASMAQPIAVKLNAYSSDQNFKVLRTG